MVRSSALGAVENNILLRQPFQTRAAALLRIESIAAPPEPTERYHLPAPGVVSSAWASHVQPRVQSKLIAADHPPGGCTTMRVTDRVAFRIERLLNYQRTVVTPRR